MYRRDRDENSEGRVASSRKKKAFEDAESVQMKGKRGWRDDDKKAGERRQEKRE